MPSPRRRGRVTAARPTCTPRSTPRRASSGFRAICWWSSRSRTPPTRSRWKTPAGPTRARRSATPSPTRCRRWNMAASPRRSAKQVIVQKVREAERDRQYRGIQGPHRRHRQRHRQARRIRQRHRRSRPRRSASSAATRCCRARCSATATASAPTSSTCAAKPADRRFSCRAPIRSSWPSCSRRKCRKSTTASSRSRRSPAIPAHAPRSA